MNGDSGGSYTPFSEAKSTVFTRCAFGDVAELVGASHIPTKEGECYEKGLTGDVLEFSYLLAQKFLILVL